MSGFVKDVTPRRDAIELVSEKLCFPWNFPEFRADVENIPCGRLSRDVIADAPYPPCARSLRDGYAVRSEDVSAATTGTPSFLKLAGSVLMGSLPPFHLGHEDAASIPTGGALPDGADSVVMVEDTSPAGGWVEVRHGVQKGDNIMETGEEIKAGSVIAAKGEAVDFRTAGALAMYGLKVVPLVGIKIGILSTGDEVMPVETEDLPDGRIRDVNGYSLKALLARYGFASEYTGIASDDGDEFDRMFHDEFAKYDVLIVSGGSSVGMRDRCSQMFESLPAPGLMVRGINIQPGKPALIAGSLKDKKLAVSLPGHPLSCMVAAYTLLIPLLLRLIGSRVTDFPRSAMLELAGDVPARTGAEKFFPCRLVGGSAMPLLAKSGYISVLADADGLIRLPENCETLRKQESAEVFLW